MAPVERSASVSIVASRPKRQFKENDAKVGLSCRFCPVLSAARYIDTLETEAKTHLLTRALRLQDRARRAEHMDASEFCYEARAWEDVFGLIQDDLALQMDKIPYTAIAKVGRSGLIDMVRRTPDATLGLRADDGGDSILEPSRLQRLRFNTNIHVCGESSTRYKTANVIFPFAVYEAKKHTASVHEAERQVAQGCDRYLGLIDSVVRDPMDSSAYQNKTSREYQMFAFTSCAASWKVYKATRDDKFYCLDPIWEGDVTTEKDAKDLLCIVDQIQKWAVDTYRPFIIQHLKRREWLSQNKRLDWNIKGFAEPEVDDPTLSKSKSKHASETYRCRTRIRYVDREEWRRESVMRRIRRPHDDIIVRRRVCID